MLVNLSVAYQMAFQAVARAGAVCMVAVSYTHLTLPTSDLV